MNAFLIYLHENRGNLTICIKFICILLELKFDQHYYVDKYYKYYSDVPAVECVSQNP